MKNYTLIEESIRSIEFINEAIMRRRTPHSNSLL